MRGCKFRGQSLLGARNTTEIHEIDPMFANQRGISHIKEARVVVSAFLLLLFASLSLSPFVEILFFDGKRMHFVVSPACVIGPHSFTDPCKHQQDFLRGKRDIAW